MQAEIVPSSSRPSTRLAPVMPPSGPPEYRDAVWIGSIDRAQIPAGPLTLLGGEDFTRARFLVRDGRRLAGFAEVPVIGGRASGDAIQRSLARADAGFVAPQRDTSPAISIVLCTRDRPEDLRTALASLVELAYPAFEVVVVDNASASAASAQVVSDLGDPRVRLVSEPRPGLARARNTGVRAARHDLIAFTDDDVAVDRHWLSGLADGFARDASIACVTGIVPSGELRSHSQLYFERRVFWSHSLTPRQYSLGAPPPDEALFPFRVAIYGTGANFAVRRSTLFDLGGFDERLGAGSPTGSGEDIDLFVRLVAAGHGLAYEPSAVIWHRHRADQETLLGQITNYGLGLGAWLTCVSLDPQLRWKAWRRGIAASRHILRISKVDTAAENGDQVTDDADDAGRAEDAGPGPGLEAIRAAELRAILKGPLALYRAGRAGARARPLHSPERTAGQAVPGQAASGASAPERVLSSLREDLVWGMNDWLVNSVAGHPLVPRLVRRPLYRALGLDVRTFGIYPRFAVTSGRNLTVGEGTFINNRCFFEAVGGVTIGQDCLFGPQVSIFTSAHEMEGERFVAAPSPRPVTIGDRCWIGGRAVILPGVTIADDVVVAAGAVVTRDCDRAGVWAGVPARFIGADSVGGAADFEENGRE